MTPISRREKRSRNTAHYYEKKGGLYGMGVVRAILLAGSGEGGPRTRDAIGGDYCRTPTTRVWRGGRERFSRGFS